MEHPDRLRVCSRGEGGTGDCSLRKHSYRATSEMKERT